MAHPKLTPHQEFIKNAFCPVIAVSTSPSSEAICRKNNLSFIELLQPFCKLGTEVHYKDPTGTAITIRNFKIVLLDVNFRPPQPTLARKFLNSSVSQAHEPKPYALNVGNMTLDIPASVPWFEAWRETFLQVQFPSDHEFSKHFLACIMVVCSSEENPLEQLQHMDQTLNQLQSVTPNKLPKWFSNNILKYYVVLDDKVDGDEDVAVTTLNSLRSSQGTNNCFLLRINSRQPGKTEEHLPDPWTQFLSSKIGMTDSINNSVETPESYPSAPTLPSKLEIGQEANENCAGLASQVYHPLSPESEELNMSQTLTDGDLHSSYGPSVHVFHGACLSTEDVQQLKCFIHEFCTRSLLPYVENQIQQLNDMVSNKKGVSRSIINVTMRWLTPNKPGAGTAVPNNTLMCYTNDALELQRRRLGDLYFMFGHFNAAFKTFHSAKKDFQTDQAWLYYAGALEMAALAAFMDNASTEKTFNYMEEGIETYLNTCNMGQFATRATLLSTECLKGCNMHGEAAKQFIKMTSEESDLRSALLLEQAAYSFLQSPKPMIRKYAFHMVFAGHRYFKAAQRKHSLRCYKQAFQVYINKGWNLADDHIYYTLGKLASNLKLFEEATSFYCKLLTKDSKQTPDKQILYLKEYIVTHNLINRNNQLLDLPILPLPLIECEATKVLVGPRLPLRTPGKIFASGITLASHDDHSTTQRWHKLEEFVVQEAQGSVPMMMKHMVTLFSNDNISAGHPMAIIGEPVQVSVKFHNPLQIVLNLKDIHLLWRFKTAPNDSMSVCNETDRATSDPLLDRYLKTHRIKSCVLQPNCKQEIILSVTPLAEGNIVIQGVCYLLCNSSNSQENAEPHVTVKGKQTFAIKGPKLKKRDKSGAAEQRADKRLDIQVKPPASCLEVSFCEINTELLCNELQQILIEFKNVGAIPLHNVHMATSEPHLLSSCEFEGSLEETANAELQHKRNHVSKVPLPDKCLEHGRSHHVAIWLKAPETKGAKLVDLLVYYENVDKTVLPKYRLVRHTWQLSIQESVNVSVLTSRSGNSKQSEQISMSAVATNMNQVHHAVFTEISLVQASLLSDSWALLDRSDCPKGVKLTSQESVLLLLRAQRARARNGYSEVSFCQHDQLTTQSQRAYMDYVRRSARNLSATEPPETGNTSNGSGGRWAADVAREAVLILRWHALVTDSAGNRRSVVGQNHIPIEKLNKQGKSATVDANVGGGAGVSFERLTVEPKSSGNGGDPPLPELQRQVSYNLLHPAQLRHDFVDNKLCVVDVRLILHSCSESSLVVAIRTLGSGKDGSGSNGVNRPALFYPYSSRHFRWVGANGLVRTIPPLKSISVSLSVAVLNPGTYDLGGHLEVWCHRLDQPNSSSVLQICRIQSAMIVTAAAT